MPFKTVAFPRCWYVFYIVISLVTQNVLYSYFPCNTECIVFIINSSNIYNCIFFIFFLTEIFVQINKKQYKLYCRWKNTICYRVLNFNFLNLTTLKLIGLSPLTVIFSWKMNKEHYSVVVGRGLSNFERLHLFKVEAKHNKIDNKNCRGKLQGNYSCKVGWTNEQLE